LTRGAGWTTIGRSRAVHRPCEESIVPANRPGACLTVLTLVLAAACGSPDKRPAAAGPIAGVPSGTAPSPSVRGVSPSGAPPTSVRPQRPAGCPGEPERGEATTAADPSGAGHLGSGAGDEANAVDIGADCTVVVGGRFSGPVVARATRLPGGGDGAVLRLDRTGRRLLSAVRVAGTVRDLEVRRSTGDIAAATDRGVRVLDPSGARVRWSTDGAVTRVAVGDRGTVAALGGTTVRVHTATGKVSGVVRLAGRTVNDVAVDDRTGLVFVTGFTQAGGPCGQVQIPFVHAYDRSGARRWKLYDYAPGDLGDLCGDTRGDRVAMGRDGKLYLAGEMSGGTTVFTTDGRSVRGKAANVGYDQFTRATNTGSAHLTYIARIDPATGAVRAGQMLLARIDTKGDQGNTITPRAITADARGRVYVGGVSAYKIAGRDRLTMNGRRLAQYAGGDAWVLVTSPDLRSRLLWTSWTDGGTGEVRGLAVDGGVAAVAARADRAPFYTTAPIQPGRPRGDSGYAAVWPARR
jgi:hypothetical protein